MTAVNNFILIVSTFGATFVLFNLTLSGSGEEHCLGGQRPKFEFWLCLTVVG